MGLRGPKPKTTGYRAEQRVANLRMRETGCDILGRRRPRHHSRHTILSEMILEHVDRRVWRCSMDIYDYVVNDYGKVCARVFYRRLAKLRGDGTLLAKPSKVQSRQLLYVKADEIVRAPR